MNQQDLYCRVINKLLNQLMKKKYNYDKVFYLNPVQHLQNKNLDYNFHSIEELVSVNIKTPISSVEYECISNDLKDCLNLLLPMIEGSN